MGDMQKAPDVKTKESTIHIDGKDYTVISYFEGKETASKLIHDMAVSRVLNEPDLPMKKDGESR